MKKIVFLFSASIALISLFFLTHKDESKCTVGVIVPMEHEALHQIIHGFEEELHLNTDIPFTIKVLNAQGDAQIQRALIDQAIRKKYDLLVPIGTSTSEMTLNLAKNQKIVCLAADINLLASSQGIQATILDDQLAVKDSLSFLHQVFPKLKKLTLLYSSSGKVTQEIPMVIEAAKKEGIEVQQLMVQSQADLYTMSQAIASDSEAIFILKDHLIVSGIQTVAQQAATKGIPVMTSDEGSVISGAAFAIGIKEANIGKQGAHIAKNILNGTPPDQIPPHTIEGPFPLFVNKEACIKQGVDLSSFIDDAEKIGFPIEYVKTPGSEE